MFNFVRKHYDQFKINRWLANNASIYGVSVFLKPKNIKGSICLHIDTIKIEAVSTPLHIYTTIKSKDHDAERTHIYFFKMYTNGHWHKARVLAQMATKPLWRGRMSTYYKMMSDRMCGKNPPLNWDGIYTFSSL